MDNADCRAAVAAVDRPARRCRRTLGGAVNAVRRSELWPRALDGGPEDPDPRPDLDAARASLEACGQPDGFDTVLAVADTPSSVEVAEEIAGQLAEVGIRVEVRPLSATTFYATDVGDPDNVAANGYGIVLATWTADFPTPGSFLAPLVDSRSIRAVGNTNYARLERPGRRRPRGPRPGGRDVAAWREVADAVEATSVYVPLAETRVQLWRVSGCATAW